MCGIAGELRLDGGRVDDDALAAMGRACAHRGPDGEGQWSAGPVGFAHRRLAVLDLTPAAAQPMHLEDAGLTVAYNGEIYNYRELRRELEADGRAFRSSSDTEVLLHAWDRWGPGCLERLNGMFAFAIWDDAAETLHLVRDRFGVKPLYWGTFGGRLLFGSEARSIVAHPGAETELCWPALSEYLTFQNVLSDRTLFEGVRLLPHGCRIEASPRDGSVEHIRWWDYDFSTRHEGDPEELADEVYRRFRRAVERQLVSEVPVGSYLSGGMDSGSITSVAASRIDRLPTFTGGFDLTGIEGRERAFDEREEARKVAGAFDTDHREVEIGPDDLEAVLPALIRHLEDPRIGQVYPNWCVAEAASREVTVLLSGMGGDELFAGYPWRYYRAAAASSPGEYLDRYFDYWNRIVPVEERDACFTGRAKRGIGDHDPFDDFRAVYDADALEGAGPEGYLQQSLYFEIKTFLHGLLTMEDKISMAHGLETRVPFLDNDLVELATGLPVSAKLRNLDEVLATARTDPDQLRDYRARTDDGKWILRKAMRRLMPDEITGLEKQGFSAPDETWFRRETLPYLEAILLGEDARLGEAVRPDYVRRTLEEHAAGENHRLRIWSFLSVEWWMRSFLDGAA